MAQGIGSRDEWGDGVKPRVEGDFLERREERRQQDAEERERRLWEQVASERANNPIEAAVSPLLIVKIVAGVFAFIGMVAAILRGMGFFKIGIGGVVAMYFVAFAVTGLCAVLAPVFFIGAGEVRNLLGRFAARVAVILVSALLAWLFVVNPILDIPRLGSPEVTRLTDAFVTIDSSSEGTMFYDVEGLDEAGERRTFDVDRDYYYAHEGQTFSVTVVYLPHTQAVIELR